MSFPFLLISKHCQGEHDPARLCPRDTCNLYCPKNKIHSGRTYLAAQLKSASRDAQSYPSIGSPSRMMHKNCSVRRSAKHSFERLSIEQKKIVISESNGDALRAQLDLGTERQDNFSHLDELPWKTSFLHVLASNQDDDIDSRLL